MGSWYDIAHGYVLGIVPNPHNFHVGPIEVLFECQKEILLMSWGVTINA
jgi:hypothetical protein